MTYLEILRANARRQFNMAEKIDILMSWENLWPNKHRLQELRSDGVTELFIQYATEERAKELFEKYPKRLGMHYHDLKETFQNLPSRGQIEWLSRHGKIEVIYARKNQTNQRTLVRYYNPMDVAALTPKDFNAPDIPDMLTKAEIAHHFGWTASMIDKYLHQPERNINPIYKTAPLTKRWFAGCIELLNTKPHIQAELQRLQKQREKRAKAKSGM